MMSFNIKIANGEELAASLRKYPVIAKAEITGAYKTAGNLVLRQMLIEEPIDTGKLRQSTSVFLSDKEVVIKPSVNYARALHEGTGRSGVPSVIGKLVAVEFNRLSPRARASLPFKPNKKGWVYFRRKRETPPNPFIERTKDKVIDQVQSVFEKAMQRITRRALGL